jgi:phosphatidylserine/phosphatidylglycerophosphate/cardiolipin synthase-like enzyme
VATALLLALLVIVATMVFNVPAGLWSQPGLAELQSGVLDSLGLARPATPTPAPTGSLPPASWYQVYFTTPVYPDKESDHHGGIDERLVQLIGGAQRSIDIAAYQLDLEDVADALLAAKARGVAVRLVTDTDYLEEKAVQRLKAGGVPVVDDKRQAIMHDKFVIIDGHTVLTGSWNLTVNCTYRNNNNAIVIESEALARNYEAEFAEMFEKHQFGPTSPRNTPQPQLTIDGTLVENYFAPEDGVAEHLLPLIRQAKKSIYFLAYSFTDDRIGQAMLERAKAGVTVAGVFESRGAETEYGEYPAMKKAGLDVWLDGNPYVMHHKVIIIDEQTVELGSFNYTASADQDNDENALVIHNADVARLYLEEYQRVRQRAVEAKP